MTLRFTVEKLWNNLQLFSRVEIMQFNIIIVTNSVNFLLYIYLLLP